MPIVPFESLPDDARLWIFGAEHPLAGPAADRLLTEVDDFLATWRAHGAPLACARDWRDGRFLAIAVDQRTAGASGCSIDGLFRRIQGLQAELGTSFVAGGRVYYRDPAGAIQSVPRHAFAAAGVTPDTRVFDTALTTAGEYRGGFEKRVAESWHATLL